jgi:hypothetical protein
VRAAPPVEVEIRRGGAWLLFAALLSGTSAAALAGWTAQQAQFPVALAAFVAAALPAWRFTPIDCGVLGWDGLHWRFANRPGDVSVMFDLGPWLLLRFKASETGRRAWLAASERSCGAAWTSLRAAVYSRRSNRDNDNTSATRM